MINTVSNSLVPVFFWGPGFSSVWDPSLGLLLAPFLDTFWTTIFLERHQQERPRERHRERHRERPVSVP